MNISSASHKLTNDKAFQIISSYIDRNTKILDLGSGKGHLCRRIGRVLSEKGFNLKKNIIATDLDKINFEATEITFKKCDFNKKLPFKNESFDLVYSIEVVEHLKSPYDFFDECFRILKPGGKLIISTPNTLHLSSRLKFFFTGFFDLFEPPSIDPKNAGRLCGHIMPLHLAYYSYGIRKAGFGKMALFVDKKKTKSIFLYYLLFLFIKYSLWREKIRLGKYDINVFNENRNVIDDMYSKKIQTSRSLFFVVKKP
jgi:SAM-dependent methyltransferase